MSYKRAGNAGALLERRNEWVAALKGSLPQFTEFSTSPLKSGYKAAVYQQAERHVLEEAVRASLLVLPDGWKDEAAMRLGRSLHGVVAPSLLHTSDYFLCSLIHPTYLHAGTVRADNEARRRKVQQQLRRTVSMPLELTATGTKSLRFAREVQSFVATGQRNALSKRRTHTTDDGDARSGHGRDSSSGAFFSLSAPWPELTAADTQACLLSFRQAGLENLVLYDKTVFPGSTVPAEVALAAFTALCGSVELVSGWSSLVHFLDRIAREQSSK